MRKFPDCIEALFPSLSLSPEAHVLGYPMFSDVSGKFDYMPGIPNAG